MACIGKIFEQLHLLNYFNLFNSVLLRKLSKSEVVVECGECGGGGGQEKHKKILIKCVLKECE